MSVPLVSQTRHSAQPKAQAAQHDSLSGYPGPDWRRLPNIRRSCAQTRTQVRIQSSQFLDDYRAPQDAPRPRAFPGCAIVPACSSGIASQRTQCFWASTYAFSTAFMRVRCPFPLALNHFTTSVSRRRCTEVFSPGITTRARFQNSAPRDSASGASGLVLSSPRSRIVLIWLRERRTMVDFSFIPARFLGADNPYEVLAAPVNTTR